MKASLSKKIQRGFTLVEVIVVAIIVAALAGVAIPMYTSYVSSSRTNAAANAAGSVASFMGACINGGGNAGSGAKTSSGAALDSLICSPSGSKIQLPIGIKIVISKLDSSGNVLAKHVNGGDSATYNY